MPALPKAQKSMVSLDTNVVIRLLVNDDAKQAKQARDVFIHNEIYITKTVILESFWVLTYTYELQLLNTAIDSLLQFISLSNVTLENNSTVLQALDLAQQGMDFARCITSTL